jgi:MinD-like ATPase involved in chromosome partitioning or flagellar assembly
VISPKGGVGKTTSAFVIGNLLADRLRLRVIAVDANPDFGTLAALAPDRLRCERSLADLLADIERIETAVQLRRYVSALPSGLHLLGAPADAEVMARLGPDAYGELLALLGTFYELVLLDLGTGVAGRLAQFAIGRADQVVLVTTPEWVTSAAVIAALEHVEHERTTVACNKFYARRPADLRELERRLRERRLHRSVAIPHDDQLATMLDTATYELRRARAHQSHGHQATWPRGRRAARLMRAVREQPRLAAAKLGVSLAALIVAALVGSALAGDDSDTRADLRPALERSEQLRRHRPASFIASAPRSPSCAPTCARPLAERAPRRVPANGCGATCGPRGARRRIAREGQR